MNYLLLVSLGPIQDFIASARRCQDLWFGSWLLSDLARVVALEINSVIQRCDPDSKTPLIFPGSFGDEKESPGVANKILAETSSQVFAQEAAKAGLNKMKDRLEKLAAIAFKRVPDLHFYRNIAMNQLNDLMEYQWVVVPCENYPDGRKLAEGLLAARKNVRTWSQVKAASEKGGWSQNVPKSSLDGFRESVFDERLYERIRNRENHDGSIHAAKLRNRYFVRGSERLCGVGLLKRVGSEVDLDEGSKRKRPCFHSTSHVASAPIRDRVKNLGKEAALNEYIEGFWRVLTQIKEDDIRSGELQRLTVSDKTGLGNKMLDGRCLYQEQLENLLETVCDNADETSVKSRALRQSLKEFFKAIDLSPDRIPTYYAVLLADGDSMGKMLDKITSAEGHRVVAKALDAFSLQCREIVKNHHGSLIFAGGDDVLALVPLHTMLQCARKLHDDFDSRIAGALKELGDKKLEKTLDVIATLSVGLGVSHHLVDMADARELAKKAEKKAKEHPGKNALCILVQMRSGGQLELVEGWGNTGDDKFNTPDSRLAMWADYIADGTLSNKAAFDLESAFVALQAKPDGRLDPNLRDMARSLAKAVLFRKLTLPKEKDSRETVEQPEARDSKNSTIKNEIERGINHCFSGQTLNLNKFSHELQIARVIGEAHAITCATKNQEKSK